jgi:uncharacterized protein YndB with AHSA1/START domain
MITSPSLSTVPEGKSVTVKKIFSRETSVWVDIAAAPVVVWALLVDAASYSLWNSAVLSIEGMIAKGEQIKLRSTFDPKRSFYLKVKELEPEKRLAWGDNNGTWVFTLTPRGDGGATTFTMSEKIGGLMFPLFARFLPSFDEAFERFAADLKREAEARNQSA